MTATRIAVPIPMPRLSDAMEEATVLTWLKAPGDPVARGEALVEIETDKATMVYEAEADGVLGELLVAEGEVAALGAPIAQLLVEGEAAEAAPAAPPVAAAPTALTAAAPPVAAPLAGARAAAAPAPARPRATPVARRVAAERGVDLAALAGSGPGGRIVRADVLAAAARPDAVAPPVAQPDDAAPPAAFPGDERIALTTTQRTIARRMVASRDEIPEFTLTREIDMTAALALRRQLVDAGHRVSVNDLVVKAAALALREHPRLNASWGGGHVVHRAQISVGIAVAADDVLLVPVIADADRKSLPQIAAEARALGERARARTATPVDLSGATFTVTNLGMLGVLSFTAVIDRPQAAILAAGAVVRRPVFDEHGAVVARDLMHVTLSCDHRVVYGAHGAVFLQRLAELLEHPTLLLLPPAAAATDEREAR